MKKSFLLITLFSLLLLSQTAFSQTSIESKVQSWNEFQLTLPLVRKKNSKGKVVDRINAVFGGILRIGRNNWDFLDNRVTAGLDYRVNKFLNLTGAVWYRKEELVVNHRNYETRLDVGFQVSKTWKKITLRDRDLYEHRFRNSRTDTNFYRHRLQITYPIHYKDKEIFAPFISEEAYLDLKTKKWVQNEFFAGITRKLSSKISLDLAYIRNDSLPTNVNGFSTFLRIKL